MTGIENRISPGRVIGLARAWGAYIRMLAAAIITRQAKIVTTIEGSTGRR